MSEYDELTDAEDFASLVEGAVPSERPQSPRSEVEALSELLDPKELPNNPDGYSQYAKVSGGGYLPTTDTIKILPPGAYEIVGSDRGPYAKPMLPPSGLLLQLPEMRADDVIKIIDRFWKSESDYVDGNEFVVGGAAFKTGLLIFGPPGSGKTCSIKLASKKLIEDGGVVFYGSGHPDNTDSFLSSFSKIEPKRKIIVIFEDIDTLIERYGESTYLDMLDSAKSVNNVMFIATTNYPKRLDARVYNRPGRFSHVIHIGMPTEKARKAYLKAILKNHKDIDKMVSLTKDFSIDHLTALVNSVYREGKQLETEIKRLKRLFIQPNADGGQRIGLNDLDIEESSYKD